MTAPTVRETRWREIINSFESNYDELLAGHTDCHEEVWLIRSALVKTGQLIHISPPVDGNGAVWKKL
jgi:hypothetical protein